MLGRQFPLRAPFGATLGTNPVGDVRAHVFAQILFQLFPVVLVVTNAFAPGTDGEEPFELVNREQRFLKLGDAFRQGLLQLQHAPSDGNTGTQFLGIKGLGNVVIRTRVES